MREKLARYKLIKAVVTALNLLPATRARGKSIFEFAFNAEPDIIVSTRGRSAFLVVRPPLTEPRREQLDALREWQLAGRAHCAVVDTVEGALAIISELAADAALVDEAFGEVEFERQY